MLVLATLKLQIPLGNTDVLAVKSVMGQTSIMTEGLVCRGIKIIGSLRKVSGTPWHMVSRIDLDEYLMPIIEQHQRTIFSTVAMLLISNCILFTILRGESFRYF